MLVLWSPVAVSIRTFMPASVSSVQDLLKVLAALPDSALSEESTLDRKAWDKAVRGAEDLAALRDALGELQSVVRDDRLSQHFARTPLLVKGAWMETGLLLTRTPNRHRTLAPAPQIDLRPRPQSGLTYTWSPAPYAEPLVRYLGSILTRRECALNRFVRVAQETRLRARCRASAAASSTCPTELTSG